MADAILTYYAFSYFKNVDAITSPQMTIITDPIWDLEVSIQIVSELNIVRVHTSCARIQPLCAILCLAYSRWMAPSELRSRAPCRRARAAAASDALAKSTKATGPELAPPLPPFSSRSRENPGQLYHHTLLCPLVPPQYDFVCLWDWPNVVDSCS